MTIHYLKVALRNLLKYKVHSFISVICLWMLCIITLLDTL